MHRTHRRRHAMVLGAIALLAIPAGFTAAQYALGDSHGLDNNLLKGSGGYNRPKRSGNHLNRNRYHAGSSKSPYVVGRNGQMVYSPHNAFSPNHRYTATGYAGNYASPSGHSRFRYHSR